ncbi:MAG TPA: DUF4349 domain-containing protein [Solirubrobacterales bacterium]|nr:DUF4349 domain-containing protein [Solirubrobacterales bacterium]
MRLDDLERELRAERPEVDPEFARKLDEWAAAGFPSGGSLDPRSERSQRRGAFAAWFRQRRERFRAVPTRKLVGATGIAALFAVIVGVSVGQVDLDGEVRPTSGGGDGAEAIESVPSGDEGGEGGGGGGSTGEPGAPDVFDAARTDRDCEYCASIPEGRPTMDALSAAPASGGENVARGEKDRLQDRTARISLGAEADEVQEVANDVVEVTDQHDGIVLDSQVTSDQGGARASFELEIPVTELDAAIADLSELGDVISRTEASEDITQPFVRAERARARILGQIEEQRIALIRADSREERLIIESRIDALKAQADTYEAQASQVERRARYASVAVVVTSNGPDSDSGWSLGDAVDDAGDVLRTIAGVGLVSLAVILPIALVGGLAFWIATAARRQSRERALDT